MSTEYKKSKDVPTEILCKRMDEIATAITACDSGKSLLRECIMRIPVELDHDADLVLSEAARRLREYAKEQDVNADAQKPCDFCKVIDEEHRYFCSWCGRKLRAA